MPSRSASSGALATSHTPTGTVTAMPARIGSTSRHFAIFSAGIVTGKAGSRSITTMITTAVSGSYNAPATGATIMPVPNPASPRATPAT